MSRWKLVILLAALPLAGCGADRNKACEPCSNTDDCEVGLSCQLFEDTANNTRNLCGDANVNMICPAR